MNDYSIVEKNTSPNEYHFYLPYYEVSKSEIFFMDFLNQNIITKPQTSKYDIKNKHQEKWTDPIEKANQDNMSIDSKKSKSKAQGKKENKEKNEKQITETQAKVQKDIEQQCLLTIHEKWVNIKNLIQFNESHYISSNYNEFFQRPMYSHFWISEKLQLYSGNSCIPLPNIIASYIPIKIHFNVESWWDKEAIQYEDISQLELGESMTISFFYVIDTLIKDKVREFENKLKSYPLLFDKFKKEEPNYKFILKVLDSEQYLYGDYSLGSYDFIRSEVRQFGEVNLILIKSSFYNIQPPLFSFPPIIRMKESEVNYEALFEKYIRYYPEFQILFCWYRPEISKQKIFLKTYTQRSNYWSKYTESGDCDFPLQIRITKWKGVLSLTPDRSNNNEAELFFPFIDPLKLNKVKQNTGSRCCKFFNFMSSHNEDEKEGKMENLQKMREKILSKQEENFQKNNEINDRWNYLKNDKMKYKEYLYDNTFIKLVEEILWHSSDGWTANEFESSWFNYCNNFLCQPRTVRLEISILYGSYCFAQFTTEPFILKNIIQINEDVLFDSKYCLLSQLPRETRWGITLRAYNSKLEKKGDFILGSCQIPIYKDNGRLQTGDVTYNLWPNLEIFPRVNISTSFSKKCTPDANGIETNNDLQELSKCSNENFCSITISFPKFSAQWIHNIKECESYRHFLEIKHKNDNKDSKNDFPEIRKLFGNSQLELQQIIQNLYNNNDLSSTFSDETSKLLSNEKKDWYPTDIWRYLQTTLPSIVKILKKCPLDKLEKEEIICILICRDYISTIPSALELFLRAIDWRNPFEVSIAHWYLKKWTPITGEDAVSLLDARFPDTTVREYAISILQQQSDEFISNYMTILCQCLLYETFLINPLSDFLITRSLLNPHWIGIKFLWICRINKLNTWFEERLNAYLLVSLMYGGLHLFNWWSDSVTIRKYIHDEIHLSKSANDELERRNKMLSSLKNQNKICFPISPTFVLNNVSNENSFKMIQSKSVGHEEWSTEIQWWNINKSIYYKIKDDIRQDAFVIDILKIIDKLWWDNNLDLKLLTYQIFPTSINSGFIENVDAKSLYEIQSKEGGQMSGSLDRELIIRFLRGTSNDLGFNGDKPENKTDNFIKSLAGYCVATSVLGITERQPSKILIKQNGIWLHINFGHIFGNKKKWRYTAIKERNYFYWTPQMANVYINSKQEELFKKICIQAFNILRHNATKLINFFIIMTTAGLPELIGLYDIEYMFNMWALDKANDEDAGNYFIELIRKSRKANLNK